jgi:hypothetical protein
MEVSRTLVLSPSTYNAMASYKIHTKNPKGIFRIQTGAGFKKERDTLYGNEAVYRGILEMSGGVKKMDLVHVHADSTLS